MTLDRITTVLEVFALLLVCAALIVLCAVIPAVGLLLLAAAVCLGVSWAITAGRDEE